MTSSKKPTSGKQTMGRPFVEQFPHLATHSLREARRLEQQQAQDDTLGKRPGVGNHRPGGNPDNFDVT